MDTNEKTESPSRLKIAASLGVGVSCAQALRALADETRLAIVEALLRGPLNVTEINQALAIEPTLLSHHLRSLKEAGLILRQRQGRFIYYELSPAARPLDDRASALDLGCCSLSFPSPASNAR